jgi:hypothetical protein
LLFFLGICFTQNAPIVLAATGINDQISFQGKVVNTNGTNVANGSYDFVFKLYTVSSAGTAVWTETWNSGTSQVTVTDGIFQVNLGTHTDLPGSIDFNTDNIYLGIEFNGDGEMSPRVHFTAAPYAFNAMKVAGLTVTDTTGTLTIPNGETISFGGSFSTTASNDIALTTSGATTLTLPTTGTLATLAGTEEFTNKTIGSTGLTFSGATTDITTASGEDLTITAAGAGAIVLNDSVTSGALTISGATTDITTGTNESLVVVANGAGVIDLQDATTVDSLTTDTGGVSIAAGQSYTGAGAVTVSSAAANTLTLDSGTTGTVNLGTGNNAKTIAIGTGTAGNTINVGTNNTASDTIAIGSVLDNVAITGDQWSITDAGVLTVASCTGCGSGSTTWDAIGDPSGNGAIAFGSTVQTMDWGVMDANANYFTFNFTNGGTSAGTDNGVVINNAQKDTTSTDTNTENLLLIQQLDTTTGNTITVNNALGIDSAASSGITTGINITNSAGNITNAISIADTAGGTITDGILITGTLTNILNSPSIDISGSGAITGATGVSTTTVTASSTIDAQGDVLDTTGNLTLNDAVDISGALAVSGTSLTATSATTITLGSTGADTITIGNGGADTITIGNAVSTGVSIVDNNWSVTSAGVGTFITGTVIGSQTFTTNNIADSGALTITSGSGTALTLNSGTTGTINIGTDASAETINIGNTGAAVKTIAIGNNTQANTITIGDSSVTSLSITENNWSISTTGAAAFTSMSSSGAIAANGGITFDNSTDTLGAFTAAGTIDLNTNILTNIGNSGTDFVASTGALTLAGVLTANGGVTLAASQTFTASSLSYMDLGAITHGTTAVQGLRLPQAASASPSSPTSGEGYMAWDASGNQVIYYNGSAWATFGAGGGYATIKDESTGLTQRTTLAFLGAGVSCADNVTQTECTISGGAGSDLQTTYGLDADGSNATISLTSADDSLIFTNPSASGTDSAFTVQISQQNTTAAVSVLDIVQSSNAANALDITANSIDTESGLSITANALTSGMGLNIASSATTFTGKLEQITLTGSSASNTGNLLLIADTGASNATTPLKVTAAGGSSQTTVLFENTGTGSSFRVNDASSDSTPFLIDASGNVGIGTSAPTSLFEIYGAGTADAIATITAPDATYDPLLKLRTGSTPAVQFTIGVDNSDSDKFKIYSGDGLGSGDEFVIDSNGVTTIANLNLGSTSFDSDAGIVSWVDMPVTASSPAATVESYSALIDGQSLFTLYALSDGVGSIDTRRVQLGDGGAGVAQPVLLGLDVRSSTGDPTDGFEGAMYYNTVDNVFRCYQNTGWTNCIGSGGSSDLQTAYGNDADGSNATISLTSADDGLVFTNPTSAGTDSAFLLQLTQHPGWDAQALLDAINHGGDGVQVVLEGVLGAVLGV